MNGTQRLMAVALASAILLGGFAFGRMSDSPQTNAAEENKAAANQLQTTQPQQAAAENQTFYLTDYKTGYNDGFNAGTGSPSATAIQTDRMGYNDGYKEGYADAIQTKAAPQAARMAGAPVARIAQPGVEYRSAQPRRGNSKLKTALTIAAPAAIGAGIGVAAGGGKGAAAGALIGGGGGALYHVIKNRKE
ncbi:MAG: hypothetical protein ACKVX9_12970 [Blastocatellia bacterium]